LTATSSRELAKRCANILDERKLEDIEIFEVADSIQITDYFVIASGRNPRHLQTAATYLSKEFRTDGIVRVGQEGAREGKWVLLDFEDVVIHLFLAESREYYDLELLWGDCPRVQGWQQQKPRPATSSE